VKLKIHHSPSGWQSYLFYQNIYLRPSSSPSEQKKTGTTRRTSRRRQRRRLRGRIHKGKSQSAAGTLGACGDRPRTRAHVLLPLWALYFRGASRRWRLIPPGYKLIRFVCGGVSVGPRRRCVAPPRGPEMMRRLPSSSALRLAPSPAPTPSPSRGDHSTWSRLLSRSRANARTHTHTHTRVCIYRKAWSFSARRLLPSPPHRAAAPPPSPPAPATARPGPPRHVLSSADVKPRADRRSETRKRDSATIPRRGFRMSCVVPL
jgi:hypothetical protein